MTLIFEIAAGIVLGVVLLVLAYIFFLLLLENQTARIVTTIIVVVLLVIVYKAVFPDKSETPYRAMSSPSENAPLETRAHFAARYKKAYPESANTPDEELVKQVLHEYPEWCPKVEGGCP